MGEVYLAEHQLLKRPCALKLIKPEAGADPIALARFEREVQSAARLAHPNTIEIFDYGHTDDGTFYYVMEYLQGMSLADLVRQDGPLPPGRVIYLFRQVCAGLAEAHGLGLVHRDLKPANIFVAVRGGESDVAKVLDFGLVKLTKDPDAAELTERHDGQRHPAVHGARAGRGRPLARCPGRHLRPRRDDVLRADGPAAVHGRERLRRDDGPRPRPRRAPVAGSAPTCPRTSSSRDPPLPGQEARRPLSRPSRPWARPWPPAPPQPTGTPTKPIAGGPKARSPSRAVSHPCRSENLQIRDFAFCAHLAKIGFCLRCCSSTLDPARSNRGWWPNAGKSQPVIPSTLSFNFCYYFTIDGRDSFSTLRKFTIIRSCDWRGIRRNSFVDRP